MSNKQKNLFSLFLLSILITGCGISVAPSNKSNQDNTNNNTTQNIPQDQNNSSSNNQNQNTSPTQDQTQDNLQREVYECSATKTTEEAFDDSYISQSLDDISYPDNNKYTFDSLSVRDIETLFNNAHQNDPTVSTDITLPNQDIWDSMSESQKVLYLINSERCARGIRLFEGIDLDIQENVTKPYAIYIANHENDFSANPHQADGNTLKQRLENGGVILGTNAQYIGENIAEFGVAYSDGYKPVYASAAKSVYGWLYLDKSEHYGHREFVLITGFNDDSGLENQEGVISVYTAQHQIKDAQGFWTKTFTVMDGFDPYSNWDENLAHIQRVELFR